MTKTNSVTKLQIAENVLWNSHDQIRFQKDNTRYGNTPWTAGYIFKKHRDSLAKLLAEPVSANLSHWIRDGWIGSDQVS
jgi:hypothetical protein